MNLFTRSLVLFGIGISVIRGETFTNPLGNGADPWVIRWQGQYYWCSSGGANVRVSKAPKLQDITRTNKVTVWSAPATGNHSKEIWAPELHYLGDKWYIYVAADDGNNFNHRIIVLEGTSQDPQGAFVFKGKINTPSDRWAIDPSILQIGSQAYMIWSGWEDTVNVRQNIYIAAMENPWTLKGERQMLSTPEFTWEKLGGSPAINEGPEALYHNGETFIIYSASGSWSDYYCLGQLRLTGANPMERSSWTKSTKAVFSSTPDVFAPGHGSFVKSPDASEDWIVYHAAISQGSGWNRNLRIQKFGWDADGAPDFGKPVSEGVALQAPSENSDGIFKPGQAVSRGAAKDFKPAHLALEMISPFRDVLGRFLFSPRGP